MERDLRGGGPFPVLPNNLISFGERDPAADGASMQHSTPPLLQSSSVSTEKPKSAEEPLNCWEHLLSESEELDSLSWRSIAVSTVSKKTLFALTIQTWTPCLVELWITLKYSSSISFLPQISLHKGKYVTEHIGLFLFLAPCRGLTLAKMQLKIPGSVSIYNEVLPQYIWRYITVVKRISSSSD